MGKEPNNDVYPSPLGSEISQDLLGRKCCKNNT